MAPKNITDDYYEILQVDQAASEASIRASFRRLAKERHPDKNPGDESATVRFQLLNEAYSKLVDPTERREYDLLHPSIVNSCRTNGATRTPSPTMPPVAQYDRELREVRHRIAELDEALRGFQQSRQQKQTKLYETQRLLNNAQSILWAVDEEEKRENAPTGWYDFLADLFRHRDIFVERWQRKQRLLERRAARELHTSKLREYRLCILLLENEGLLFDRCIQEAHSEKTRETQREKDIIEKQARWAKLSRQKQEQQAKQARRDAAARSKAQAAWQEREKAQSAERARQQQQQQRERERKQEAAQQADELSRRQREKHEAAQRARLVQAVERKRMADEAEEVERRRQATEAERVQNEAEGRRRQALFERMNRYDGRGKQEPGTTSNKHTTDSQSKNIEEEQESIPAGAPRRSHYTASHHEPGQKVEASRVPPPHPPPSGPSGKACLHGQWWPRIPGQFTCERCRDRIHRFAFRCPSCAIVACVRCRNALKK